MAFTISYTYKALDKFTAPLAKMAKEVDRLNARIAAATNRTAVALLGVDKAAGRARSSVSALGKVNGYLQGMALNAERYAVAMRKVGSVRMPSAPGIPGGRRGRTGGGDRGGGIEGIVAAGGAMGITAGLASAARASMELETSLLDVRRLSDLDPKGVAEFDAMTANLSKRFAKSRAELNQMASSAISAGVSLGDMEKFLSFSSMAAVAAEFGSAEEAGQVLGTIQAQLRIGIDEMIRLGDQVNVVADKTNTTSQKMFDVLERGAGTMAGWATESQTAMAGFFSNLEPRSEKAATALSAMITKLKVMDGAIGKQMQEDGVKGLKLYFSQLSKIEDPLKRQRLLLKHFGQEHVDVAEKAMVRISELDDLLAMVSSSDAVGSLEREYALSMSGMQGATLRFKASWENLKAVLFDKGVGASFLSRVTKAVERVSAFAEANPKLAQFITVAAGATAVALALAGGIALVGLALAPITVAGLAVAGVVAGVAGALLLAWTYCEPLREQLSALGEDFEFLSPVVDVVTSALGFLFKLIGKAIGSVLLVGIGAIRTLLNNFKMVATVLGAVLTGNWGDIKGIMAEAGAKNLEIGNESWDALSKTWTNWDGGSTGPANAVDRAEGARQETVSAMPEFMAAGAPSMVGVAGLSQPPVKMDITVRAEPGTAATVNKASLPTGSNVRSDK